MNIASRALATLVVAVFFLVSAHAATAQSAQSDAPPPVPSAGTPTVFDQPDLVQRYQATITPEDLAAHLYVFASDYFEGRETGTRGQKLAAYYLAGQYRKMGVEPKGTAEVDSKYAPEAYLQPVPLYGNRLKAASLNIASGDETSSVTFSPDAEQDDLYFTFGTVPHVEGGVVFLGYGIADDELGYNDIAAAQAKGIDLSGKWIMFLRDEPLASASVSLLPTEDGTPSQWTTGRFQKLRAFFASGNAPAGILVVGDTGPRGEDVGERARSAVTAIRQSVGRLSLEPSSGNGRQIPPIYTISSDLADRILASTGRTVERIRQSINQSLEPVVFDVPQTTLTSTIEQESYETRSENVVAFIEGSDPVLKNEVVVLSSHYDHIGIDATAEGDQINNGADDDGSGTVSVLEMAEAFAKAKADGFGPRRSILFLNVTGEEKGLLGSSYFTDVAPVVPLDRVVTDLNIDMIGRHDPTFPGDSPHYVYIIGSNLISEELDAINKKVNTVTGIDLELNERFNTKDDPNQFYRRSDHWNFGKHEVPFIFFFTGTHEDYHGVGDEPQKIDYDRMADIARLIFATAWQVANQDAPPAVSGKGFN